MTSLTEPGKDNARLRRLATCASVTVAVVLILVKVTAYTLTGSIALLSSLLDSVVDLVASLVTAYGVASALRPPDQDHRYGHGKAEPLAVLAQAAVIIGSALFLTMQAVSRLSHPIEIEHEQAGYLAMAIAIGLTLALVLFQRYVVQKTASMAINADKIHYIGDVAVNLAVVAAFALHHLTGQAWFDSVFALAIAAGMLVSAFNILRRALTTLMDQELPAEQRSRITKIVERQPGVFGVHDLRTRSDSDRIFLDLHVEMDGDITLRAAHELSVRISTAIRAEIPNADVTIHQDPAGLVEDRRDTQIEKHKV